MRRTAFFSRKNPIVVRSTATLFVAAICAFLIGRSHVNAQTEAAETPAADQKAVVHSDFYGDPLPVGALARMGSLRLRPGVDCSQLMFSADGKQLISGAEDGVIRFWDPETGKELHSLTVKGSGLAPLAVSPDGKTLAAAGVDEIYLFDAKTHEKGTILHVDRMGVCCLAFSPDSKTLATAGDDKIIRLWDVASGKERRKLEGHEQDVVSVAFSPDGALLAARDEGLSPDGYRTNGFRMWDVASGKICWKTDSDSPQPVFDFRFLPDGTGLDIQPDRFRVLNAKVGKELRVVKTGSLVPSSVYVISPNGKEVLAIGSPWDSEGFLEKRTTIVILSLDGVTAPEFLDGSIEGLYQMALSPDGKTLATLELVPPKRRTMALIRVWDWTARSQKDIPPGHKAGVSKVFFLPDGKTLVTGGGDGAIRFWDAASGKELRRLGSEKDPLGLLAPAPDGSVLALRFSKREDHGSDRLVHILDALTDKELPPLEAQGPEKGRQPALRTWVLSPDGKTLAAGTTSGVHLWDVASGRKISLPDGMRLPAYRLAFSPDGATLAVMGQEIITIPMSEGEWGRVHIWDLKAGKERLRLGGDGTGIIGVAFAPEGGLLACAGGDLRDARTGKVVGRTNQDQTPARGGVIAFSPDGKLFAMPCAADMKHLKDDGQSVAVLEAATCREVCRFDNGGSIIGDLAFAPDGMRLASGYVDGTALVWDLRTMPGASLEAPGHLDVDALARLWDDLDARDAAVGYRAVCMLAAAPKEALEFLARHLTKAPPRNVEGIRRLITDLSSNDFETREAATRKLKEFGSSAEPELKEAAASPTAETRQRTERLLADMDSYALTPGRLREIRAVQALERIGTPEARRQLDALTEGEPLAPLTHDAKAAVERLRGKEARP